MARTEIHPISSTLNIAIDYIIDPEKTDGQKLCSTYECTLQCAAMDFEDVHMQGTGRTTVLAQHMIQSFKPGEVSPDEAHKIGRELCDKYLKPPSCLSSYTASASAAVSGQGIPESLRFTSTNLISSAA